MYDKTTELETLFKTARRVFKRKAFLFMFAARLLAWVCLAALGCGCANGVIRYKTLGYRRYATGEMSRIASPRVLPLAIPAGAGIDVVVGAADAVALPVAALYVALMYGGPDGKGALGYALEAGGKTPADCAVVTLASPFWLTVTYPLFIGWIPFAPLEAYDEWLGKERAWRRGEPRDNQETTWIEVNGGEWA